MGYRYLVIILVLFFNVSAVKAQQALNSGVKVQLVNDTLCIQNNRVSFKYLWNEGNIILKEITQKQNTKKLSFTDNKQPSFFLPQESSIATDARLEMSDKRTFPNEHVHKEVLIYFKLKDLEIKHSIKIYPNANALSHTYFLRGNANASNWVTSKNSEYLMIEKDTHKDDTDSGYIGAIPLDGNHWKATIISFKEATDYNDNLVFEKNILPYRKKGSYAGNVLYAQSRKKDVGLFFIKEAPIQNSQQYYPGYDFQIDQNLITIHGLGISPKDLAKDWVQGYGYAVGIAASNKTDIQLELLNYQKQLRRYIPERDGMILANTWGDRSKDSRMNETFILKEIEKAAEIGVTHLQLDDGWQKGLSRNSASKAGQKWDDWSTEDWKPHPERFPHGFDSIIKTANRMDVKICLWFNPSKANSYALWERDADILIDYYKNYNIKVFKIDGMSFADKQSEINLRKLFTKVMDSTNGNVTFNMDVTAGNRVGYHYFNEFGNIFLENRYTDWGNYYPHRTLRNLWQLSAYIPTERLQIEFLNNSRNPNKYSEDDVLAPSKIPITYTSAVTLMAQPLAWMELSNLNDTEGLVKQFAAYKNFINDLHDGITLPIGNEPSGFSWTGFMVYKKDQPKYIIVYNEASKNDDFELEIKNLKSKVKLKKLLGDTIKVRHNKKNNNSLFFRSSELFSYSIFFIE